MIHKASYIEPGRVQVTYENGNESVVPYPGGSGPAAQLDEWVAAGNTILPLPQIVSATYLGKRNMKVTYDDGSIAEIGFPSDYWPAQQLKAWLDDGNSLTKVDFDE